MPLKGKRQMITAYVDQDVYDFINSERGRAGMSEYVRDVLTAYAELCMKEDQKGANKNQEMVVA